MRVKSKDAIAFCAHFARRSVLPFEPENAREWRAFSLRYRGASDRAAILAARRERALGPNSTHVEYRRVLDWATGWSDLVLVRVRENGKPTPEAKIVRYWTPLV